MDDGGELSADDLHHLYTGWVLGVAMLNGLPFNVVRDLNGDYTHELEMTLDVRGVTVTITVVVPAPPDGWTLAIGGE